MKIRTVITGHDTQGQACVTADREVEATTVPLMPGYGFHMLWSTAAVPTFPDDGSQTPCTTYFPPQGGSRFLVFTIPAERRAPPPRAPTWSKPRRRRVRRYLDCLRRWSRTTPACTAPTRSITCLCWKARSFWNWMPAFLTQWSALEDLDLRSSGALTDLDALSGLKALQKIRIRGATIKRDAWPASLKDSLDTR